jgi:hypothetical protein
MPDDLQTKPVAKPREAEKHPGGRPLKLIDDPDIEQRLLRYIRAGGYDWVACESAGIGRSTFYRWMQQGDEDEAAGRLTQFREFRDKVRQAHADSRLAAEIEVKRTNPDSWLRNGPGRTRPDAPGWTNSGDGNGADKPGTVVNVVVQPVWIEIRTALLNALEPFPEARAVVAQVLAQPGGSPGPDDPKADPD